MSSAYTEFCSEAAGTPHSELTLEQALAELERLGSTHDPIRIDGRWTTPVDAWESVRWQNARASSIAVSYYSGARASLVANGRLSAMVADRRKIFPETLDPGARWAGEVVAELERTDPHNRSQTIRARLLLGQLERLFKRLGLADRLEEV